MDSENNTVDKNQHKGKVWEELKNEMQSEKYTVGIMPQDMKDEDQTFDTGIEKEVCYAANGAGIKIPNEYLKNLTLVTYHDSYEGTTMDKIEQGYGKLLHAIVKLVYEYDGRAVCVGHTDENKSIAVYHVDGCPDLVLQGEASNDTEGADFCTEFKSGHLYPPKAILQNVILTISKAARDCKQDKEKKLIRDLQIATRIIDSIAYENLGQDYYEKKWMRK
jgi:hypothetical protein